MNIPAFLKNPSNVCLDSKQWKAFRDIAQSAASWHDCKYFHTFGGFFVVTSRNQQCWRRIGCPLKDQPDDSSYLSNWWSIERLVEYSAPGRHLDLPASLWYSLPRFDNCWRKTRLMFIISWIPATNAATKNELQLFTCSASIITNVMDIDRSIRYPRSSQLNNRIL